MATPDVTSSPSEEISQLSSEHALEILNDTIAQLFENLPADQKGLATILAQDINTYLANDGVNQAQELSAVEADITALLAPFSNIDQNPALREAILSLINSGADGAISGIESRIFDPYSNAKNKDEAAKIKRVAAAIDRMLTDLMVQNAVVIDPDKLSAFAQALSTPQWEKVSAPLNKQVDDGFEQLAKALANKTDLPKEVIQEKMKPLYELREELRNQLIADDPEFGSSNKHEQDAYLNQLVMQDFAERRGINPNSASIKEAFAQIFKKDPENFDIFLKFVLETQNNIAKAEQLMTGDSIIAQLEEQIARMEQQLADMPTSGPAFDALSPEIKALTAQVDALEQTINNYYIANLGGAFALEDANQAIESMNTISESMHTPDGMAYDEFDMGGGINDGSFGMMATNQNQLDYQYDELVAARERAAEAQAALIKIIEENGGDASQFKGLDETESLDLTPQISQLLADYRPLQEYMNSLANGAISQDAFLNDLKTRFGIPKSRIERVTEILMEQHPNVTIDSTLPTPAQTPTPPPEPAAEPTMMGGR